VVCCNVLQYEVVCCSVLQCVACVLQCVREYHKCWDVQISAKCVAVCFSVCCSALHACCSV